MSRLYFAFGSNMDGAQMARRCPGVRPLELARLDDHRLVFRGPSRNRGQGVLSVDPSPGDAVMGLLYAVTDAHLRALDGFEGAPQWYVRATRTVVVTDGTDQEAVIYRLPEHVTEMAPTQAYQAQVAAAFRGHGLDESVLRDAIDRALRAT